MKNIPFILKIAVKPLLVLTLLITVSLVGFSKAFSEIGSLRQESEKASKSENVLKSKLDVLSESQASVATDANYAVSFLPGENPALLVLYQLRAGAASSGLLLSDFKVGFGTGEAGGLQTTSVSFDIEGPLQQILDFVNLTKSIAPNVWIAKTELNFSGETLQATIDMISYWSAFPTKMPALTEAITSLDNSEKEILAKISSYSRPSFVSLTPAAPRENLNPFGE